MELGGSFFEVAEPLDHGTFLSVCDDVLRDSLLLLAPFGLPRYLHQALGSEKEFLRHYGPRFRFVLEAVSDAIYRERGVSESEVAVTLHKYTEEEQSPEAIAYLTRMSESLRSLYTPPRVLDLPPQAPSAPGDLVTIGMSLLKVGAIYAPDPPVVHAGETGAPLCGDMAPYSTSPPGEGGSPAGRGGCAPSEKGVALQARSAAAGYYARHGGGADSEGLVGGGDETVAAAAAAKQQQQQQQLLLQGGGNAAAESARAGAVEGGGEADREKDLRARVTACLSALKSAREEQEAFSEDLQQAHIQALTEAFEARYSAESSSAGGGEPTADAPEDPSSRRRVDVAALAEFAAVPFLDNELFVLIRALQRLLRCATEEREEEASGVGGGATSGKVCEDPEACLESVLTSQSFRVLAEQSVERGLDREAAGLLEEAIAEMEAFVKEAHRLPRPSRYLAELRAGLATCQMHQGNSEAASVQAERALAEHPLCGEAFLVRGQCRRSLGDTAGALSDLVTAFVLRGSALNAPGDGGEAQAIEDVSRDNCRERAGETFSLRAAPNALPAGWVVRSFFASYDTKDLYEEHDSFMSLHPMDDGIEGPLEGGDAERREGARDAVVFAFWRGISLVRQGEYAESIAKFSEAVALGSETAGGDARMQSLALEYHGSFLYLMGDMAGALEHLSRAGEVDATNAKSWVKRGSVLSDLGRREEALECFDAAEAIAPRDSDLFLHRGQGHLLANDFRKAAADLRRSVELCPTMAISRAAWGVALFKLATTDELPSPTSLSRCLHVMEEARERFPDNPEVLFFFAEVLISMGDFSKGLEYLKQAAALDPECPIPYVNAARAYLGMNDTKTARRHLERASELDSSYPGTCLDLGQLLMQEGSPAEALSTYARGVEKARFPSELHDAMACLDVAEAHLKAQRLLHPAAK